MDVDRTAELMNLLEQWEVRAKALEEVARLFLDGNPFVARKRFEEIVAFPCPLPRGHRLPTESDSQGGGHKPCPACGGARVVLLRGSDVRTICQACGGSGVKR